MNLVPNDPRSLITQFQSDLNRVFGGISRWRDDGEIAALSWAPQVDVKEEAGRFLVRADVPGVEPKDIEVTLHQGTLTIRGKRESESRQEKDGWLRTERSTGEFFRRLVLPDSADPERVEAHSDKGVLEISIPKRALAQAKRVEVKS